MYQEINIAKGQNKRPIVKKTTQKRFKKTKNMKKKPQKKGGLPPDWSVSLWITSQWVGEPLGCHARSSLAMTEGTVVVIARSGA